MEMIIKVLSNNSDGMESCCLSIQLGKDLYLFNTPEGSLRALKEQKTKQLSGNPQSFLVGPGSEINKLLSVGK